MPQRPISTIFFDVGGTILTVQPSVGKIYADAATRLGFDVDPGRVNANFKEAWKRSLRRRQSNGHVCDDEVLRADWCQVVVDSFEGLLPPEVATEAFRDLYDRFCRADAWRIADGARETFEELGALGYRLGILSNWDHRLEETLESLGLLGYFEFRVISYRVGVEKPHPKIFQEALREAGVPAREALHIGDSFEWDIEPAHALGLRALWLRDGKGPIPEISREAAGGAENIDSVSSFRDILPFIRGLENSANSSD